MGSGDIDLSHLNAIVGDCDVRCSTVIGKGSPIALVLMEKYRALATKLAAMGPTVPVDTFLFGHGDPDERHQSRINGVPYRPADRPWPVDPDWRPMVFFAQFCFSDSRDHVGVLPGDVLLIFIRVTKSFLLPDVTVPWVVSHEPESLAFEWYPLGLNNLVEPGLIPFTDMVFPRCYLSRHRSVDYIDEQIAIRAIAAVVPPDEFSSNEFMQSCELCALCRFPGYKIGGMPFWYSDHANPKSSRFIASILDVAVEPECPYPYVNLPDALSVDESLENSNYFSFRDGCVINLFLRTRRYNRLGRRLPLKCSGKGSGKGDILALLKTYSHLRIMMLMVSTFNSSARR